MIEAGITTFDTAEAYGKGHSERILASVTSNIRDKLIYATKVFANHLKYDQVLESCHRSLKNLQTDYIDLYQIHWPSGSFGFDEVPIGETMGALNELKEQGKIRSIGVSNFSRRQLQEAAEYSRIESLQPPYSLFWRQVEKDAMSFCVENKITILAYSPMAQGLVCRQRCQSCARLQKERALPWAIWLWPGSPRTREHVQLPGPAMPIRLMKTLKQGQ
jgi:aryl-alcohol dehydrogenase-like predicted oxidoreductase